MVRSRILIVEDEQIVAHELQRSLESVGYDVSIADNGEAALAYASEMTPNLVLLDIVLPGRVDGIAAAEQFQSLNIPVVYMTGHTDVNLFERARQTQPFGYLTKPLRDHDLSRVIQLALLKHQSEVRRKKSIKENVRLSKNLKNASGKWLIR